MYLCVTSSYWREEEHPEIDTPKKYWAARLIANKMRRDVSGEEVRAYMNKLADILLDEGVKLGKISGEIAEITGYSNITVRKYLKPKYKETKQRENALKQVAIMENATSGLDEEPEVSQVYEFARSKLGNEQEKGKTRSLSLGVRGSVGRAEGTTGQRRYY